MVQQKQSDLKALVPMLFTIIFSQLAVLPVLWHLARLSLIVEKFVNIRLHFTPKQNCTSFAQTGQKRNRKLMKVSHM
jgi:hypothetical protein